MQKYILIFMVFFYNWSYGQQFPVKRTFEYSKWFTIKGENQKKVITSKIQKAYIILMLELGYVE